MVKLVEVIDVDDYSSDVAEKCADNLSSNMGIHPNFVYSFIKNVKQVKVLGRILHKSDLLLLHPNRWLNDKIINSYLEMVQMNCTRCSIKCFNTFFYSSLCKNKKYTFNENLRKYKLLFFPIHRLNHWSLVVYNFSEIRYYDSLRVSLPKLDIVLNIRTFLKETLGIKSINVRLMSNIPHQRNTDDCGVFLCQFVKFIAYDIQLFNTNDINKLRSQMLHEILKEKIIYKP